ncbi:MAG: DUF3603 family protein [Candidatus Aenigmarchaeota archaeon]|nr:DUF3603 family protein [Candidatus Aenigmarchaeota archaeon]
MEIKLSKEGIVCVMCGSYFTEAEEAESHVAVMHPNAEGVLHVFDDKVILPVIAVSWCRKSCIGQDEPFAVKFDYKAAELFHDVKVLKVSQDKYDAIGKSLDDMDQKLLTEVQEIQEGKYTMWGFVVTDSERWLAVDTQGYNYPRYKSPVCIDGRILALLPYLVEHVQLLL